MTIVSLPLGVVVVLDEGLARPITLEMGSECHAVWSARRGTRCIQSTSFLRCTRLRAIVGSTLSRDGQFVHQPGLGSGSRLGLSMRGTR
jgi:hypothetical protein